MLEHNILNWVLLGISLIAAILGLIGSSFYVYDRVRNRTYYKAQRLDKLKWRNKSEAKWLAQAKMKLTFSEAKRQWKMDKLEGNLYDKPKKKHYKKLLMQK